MQQLCVCAVADSTLMKMVKYKTGVVLMNLCWSSGLHPADENTETLPGSTSQRGAQIAVTEEWFCPTWYQAVKDSVVMRCVCVMPHFNMLWCVKRIHNKLYFLQAIV